ncbi:MAG: adenosine kinase [Deltaproteobacteria bacterium]|nr:adenosine kinase [Deltaproteobacteria bacterium]
MNYDLLGIGNALLDYQVEVPFQFLEDHGFKRGSMTLVDADFQHRLLAEIQTKFGTKAVRRTSGGCSANTLTGLSSYGGTGAFIGKVANDEAGEFYRSDMQKYNIPFHTSAGSSEHTGTCLALITPDAERTMLTHLGIATHLSEADIEVEKIKNSKFIYIEGYLWDPPSGRAASKHAIKIAKELKKKVSFSYSDSFCVERHFDDFIELSKSSIDIVFCNESEALHATKTSNVQDAFRIMQAWSNTICITIGAKGALLSENFGKNIEEIPTWEVKLIDKLGAGDLFASGVLFGLSQGRCLREAGHLGCFSATRVIQQMGARLEENLSLCIDEASRGPSENDIAIAV